MKDNLHLKKYKIEELPTDLVEEIRRTFQIFDVDNGKKFSGFESGSRGSAPTSPGYYYEKWAVGARGGNPQGGGGVPTSQRQAGEVHGRDVPLYHAELRCH